MKIKHSIPRHNCFTIMQPARGNYSSRCFLANKEAGELYELEDIESGEIKQTVLLDYFTFTLEELPNSICYITYGQPAADIKRALMSKFPGLNSESKIEVLILMNK